MLMPRGGGTKPQVRTAGSQPHILKTDFKPRKHAFIAGQESTHMKLSVDADTDRVLAALVLRADASEIVQRLAVALTAGACKADFDNAVTMHPTAAEEFVLLREVSREVSPLAMADG